MCLGSLCCCSFKPFPQICTESLLYLYLSLVRVQVMWRRRLTPRLDLDISHQHYSLLFSYTVVSIFLLLVSFYLPFCWGHKTSNFISREVYWTWFTIVIPKVVLSFLQAHEKHLKNPRGNTIPKFQILQVWLQFFLYPFIPSPCLWYLIQSVQIKTKTSQGLCSIIWVRNHSIVVMTNIGWLICREFKLTSLQAAIWLICSPSVKTMFCPSVCRP